ncbi:hypothetical protein GUJ93_ZPchr0005g15793 [Zizania palustris]|uniref:Uncharacterized protein n=1 Tax=Zizania palustris TaxID=103762 RepID=A0A8J5SLF2_ZIZPA|nr:hypothetical protein GUJ93_ZPchr0005g15793 [Zizania palustris]
MGHRPGGGGEREREREREREGSSPLLPAPIAASSPPEIRSAFRRRRRQGAEIEAPFQHQVPRISGDLDI